MEHPLKICGMGAALVVWYLTCPQTDASELRSSRPGAAIATQADLSTIDLKFISLSGISGATELAAAKLALTQSSNMKVQYFARQMISDHGKMARVFNDMALHIGWAAPAYGPDPAIRGRLKKIKQIDFDQAYIGNMAVVGQRQAVDLFALEANQGRNDELRMFATRMLPVIRHHFKMGEQLIREIVDDPEKPIEHREIPVLLISEVGHFGLQQ
jgi:putative membrane protein